MSEYKYAALSGKWDDINGESVRIFKGRDRAIEHCRMCFGDYGVVVRVALLRDDPGIVTRRDPNAEEESDMDP